MPEAPHRMVIIGGGFGGLNAAQQLRNDPVEVTLLDRRNHHLFQPLLYQVATGSLSPANIASPLRAVLRRQRNARVLLFEVTDIDVVGQRVLSENAEIPYETLLVATGARDQYFGHDEWARYAPGLKSLEEATDIRRRVLYAFEMAECETDAAKRSALLTFVVVGGGPTGVELAGSLAELAHYTLRSNFRRIDPADARIFLIEGTDKVLGTFADPLPTKAAAKLQRMGVTVRTGALVTDIRRDGVTLKSGNRSESLPAHTVLWAAGVRASALGAILAEKAGAALDRAGRVIVQPDLTVPGHPEIFVVGDLANCSHDTGKPLPGVAQVAIQGGRYAARLIRARLKGQTLPPFQYSDHGSMATIGRAAAVAQIGKLRLTGYPAWLAWLLIHILFLIEHENRLLVLFQWAWSYFTRNRSARLITGDVSDLHECNDAPAAG